MLPTEDLFVHLYVLVDDAIIDGVVAIPPRPGPVPACSDAEVLTIALARHVLGRRAAPGRARPRLRLRCRRLQAGPAVHVPVRGAAGRPPAQRRARGPGRPGRLARRGLLRGIARHTARAARPRRDDRVRLRPRMRLLRLTAGPLTDDRPQKRRHRDRPRA
jgi:hypothetical protein